MRLWVGNEQVGDHDSPDAAASRSSEFWIRPDSRVANVAELEQEEGTGAKCREQIVERFAADLTACYGRSFSIRDLRLMHAF